MTHAPVPSAGAQKQLPFRNMKLPHFPALRSDPMALSGASRRKQIPCSKFLAVVLPLALQHAGAGIVAHYSFDEHGGTIAHDMVGNVNGNLLGGAIFQTGTGVSGSGAIYLDRSTSALVNMGDHFGFASSFSIQAWVKLHPGESMVSVPFGKHIAGAGIGYYTSINEVNAGMARFYPGNYPFTSLSSSVLNDGQWHHLTVTFDNAGGVAKLYVNGQPEGATTGASTNNSSTSFLIGGTTAGPTFTGWIDEVKIFDTALSADEVRALHALADSSLYRKVPVTAAMLSASSTLGGYTPETAFDGIMDQNTGWTAIGGQKQAWLVVDFGTVRNIAHTRVFPDRYIATDPSYSYLDRFWVEAWIDGAWQAVTPLVATPSEAWHQATVNQVTSKLRIWCETDGNSPQVKEIEIIEIFAPPPSLNISQADGGLLRFEWDSRTGTSYHMQSSADLSPNGWSDEGSPVQGTGEILTRELPRGSESKKFFRLKFAPTSAVR
jgi:hypothetical protein